MGLSKSGYIKSEIEEKNMGIKYDEIIIGIFVCKIFNEFNKIYIKDLLNFSI